MRHARHAVMGGGRHVDDRSAAGWLERKLERCLGHVEHALDVEPPARAPAFRRDQLRRCEVLATGGVHEQLQGAGPASPVSVFDVSARPLVLVSGLTACDYLLWTWALNPHQDVPALVAGLTLPPLAAACLLMLVLGLARLVGRSANRAAVARSAARAEYRRPCFLCSAKLDAQFRELCLPYFCILHEFQPGLR